MFKNIDSDSSLKSTAAKGMIWSGLSNILQQLLGFVFGIYLARLLTPTDYGMIGMIAIFSVIASSLQESGFINGIANLQSPTRKDYNAVFWTCIIIAFTLYIILFFCAPLIAKFYEIPELKNLARLSFLSFLVGSFGVAHNAYLFRNMMFKERALASLFAIIASGLVGVSLAYKGYAYWGIAIQTITYSLINTLSCAFFSKFTPSFTIDLSPIKSIIKYSSKILITNIFIRISDNIFPAILGKNFSSDDVGHITQASKWNLMVQSLVSGISNSTTQPILREVHNQQDRHQRIFRKLVAITSFLAFPLMFGLSLISADFIKITITEKWSDSAMYLSIIAIGGAFAIISVVFSNVVLSKGNSQSYMIITISFVILQLISLIILAHFSILFMVIASSLLQFIWLFIWFSIVRKHIAYTYAQFFEDVFSYALMAAVTMVITHYIVVGQTTLYTRFASTLLIAAALYVLINRLFHPGLLKEIINLVRRKIR